MLVIAATVTASGLAGCDQAHTMEPGIGSNFPIINHTRHDVQVLERSQARGETLGPFNPVTDNRFTIAAGATHWLGQVQLAPNDCIAETLQAYIGNKLIAQKAAPLCADAKGHAGWTITTSPLAEPTARS